jgi:SanA protein
MRKFMKKATKVGFYFFLLVSIFVLLSNIWVVTSTKEKILSDVENLPDSSVALVLGTSHRLTNGYPNPYFEDRILSAAALYKSGKATHFLLSGDNRTKYYNEPEEMKKALIKEGVPSSAITLDYAGLRTLDSIVRSKEIFGQTKIIIVTQPFHCYRALFISNYYEIDAVALWPSGASPILTPQLNVREWFARAKAVLDLYILKTSPMHLGNKEPLDFQN